MEEVGLVQSLRCVSFVLFRTLLFMRTLISIPRQSSRYGELGGADRVPRGELPAGRVVAVRPRHHREQGRHVEAERGVPLD